MPRNVVMPQGGNLTTLANQNGTTLPDILKLNPQYQANPNMVQAGANIALPDLPAIGATTPQGQTQQPSQGTPTSVTATSTNPALSAIYAQANKLISDITAKGGTLSPENLALINQINGNEAAKTSAIAGARTSADQKDASTLDQYITKAEQAQKDQQATIDNLISSLQGAQSDYVNSLTPTGREQELQKKLADLRTGRQLLPLELRNAGVGANGIAATQVNDERVRAIQEQNLLTELGMEQDARKMKSEGLKSNVSFIGDNIDLQMKIQDKLQQNEKDILAKAQTLQKDSLSALGNIVKTFEGLSFEDMDTETQSQLIQMASANGIPFGLLKDALKNAKQQQVFNQATTVTEIGGNKVLINSKTGQTIKNLGKATSGGTDQSVIDKFNTALADRSTLDQAGTREQFIRQLRAKFPSIDPSSIAEYVYGTYPDNYEGGNNNGVDYYVKQIKAGAIDISNVPAAMRSAVASKL